MSFEQLTVKELKEAMTYFGVESEKKTGKENFIAALEQDGIGFDDYTLWKSRADAPLDSAIAPVEVKAAAPVKPVGNQVLVKMERQNPRYDTFGFTFTKEHPYVLMSEDEAQEIFDNEKGFRPAMPREAQEYYS